MAKRTLKEAQPVVVGDVAYVPLTQGFTSIIDAADVGLVDQRFWRVIHNGRTMYAQSGRGGSQGPYFRLHRVILGLSSDGPDVDHIDHDGLNNRRSNLRIATEAQNQANLRPQVGGTSQYKGVCWNKAAGKWQVTIRGGGRRHFLGLFDDEAAAAVAYDLAASELHGEFARLNLPDGIG
jgi:hypothetical protein